MGYSFRSFTKAQKIQTYVFQNKPAIRSDALFADGTGDYRIPAEPMPGDSITLKFRTAKGNVDHVYLICDGNRMEMKVGETDAAFDYYYTECPGEHTWDFWDKHILMALKYFGLVNEDVK